MRRADFDLSVGQRLALGFGLILLLLLVQLVVFFTQARVIDEQRQRVDLVSTRSDAAVHLQTAYFRAAIAARSYALSAEATQLEEFRLAAQDSVTAMERLAEIPKDPDGQVIFERVESLARVYDDSLGQFLGAVTGTSPSGNAQALERTMNANRGQLFAEVDAFVGLQREKSTAALAELTRAEEGLLRSSLLLGSLIVLVGLMTSYATITAVRRPVRRLVAAAGALGRGEYRPALALAEEPVEAGAVPKRAPRDELRVLSSAFAGAARSLRAREERLAARNRVASALASGVELEKLANESLRQVAAYTRSEIGAVYLLSEESSTELVRAGSFSMGAAGQRVSASDGIVGEAATSGQRVVVFDIPEDTPWRLDTGFGEVPVRSVAALPIEFQHRVFGVLLLGALRTFTDDALDFAAYSAQQMGVSLQNALAHARISLLALDLQVRNEEIQAQNEELQAQNEEIQAQSEEIQAQNEELQAQSEEIQVQNEELREADRMKDEFLAMASHELKSPITSIKGYSQLLLRRASQQVELMPFADMLSTIDRSSGLLLQRINRLLDVSRARMGRIELHHEEVELGALAEQQVELARMRTKEHRIVFSGSARPLYGNWDRSYLEQAIGNLLDNAIRYSPNGGDIVVTVGADGGEAILSVADEGIGIPPDEIDKIFQSYYRHESAKRVTGDGLGIGLYMTKQIVVAHGGRIWVRSAPDKGSTFSLALPLETTVAVRSAPEVEAR